MISATRMLWGDSDQTSITSVMKTSFVEEAQEDLHMDWNQRFCPNQSCNIDFWMVQQAADDHELRHVIDRFGGAFLVAATDPVCLRCGTTLCLTVELAHRMGGDVLEAGPLLEYVRNLPR